MKRNLLAIAIPALLVAGAANASIEVWNKDGNKLNINGRVKAANHITDRDNKIDKEGDNTEARLGFTGETQITDSVTGYGRAEWNTKANGSSVETRYAFAGLNFGDIGSIDYGKNDGIVKAITSYTDVLPEFGGDASDKDLYLLSERTTGVVTYRNSNLFGLVDGFNFALQYADEEGNNKNSAEAYGLNFDYKILDTGLSLAGAYSQARGGDDRTWGTGLKYDANDLYVAAIYVDSRNKDDNDKEKYRGFEVVAQYGIDFEVGRLTPSIAYVQHKSKIDGDSEDLVKYVEVGASYDFSKNITAIVDYKINLLDEDDVGKPNSKDTVGLGLIYQF
ncbi:MAG: porin [Candidatus Schmidhempelia sp.]|nr:porin [Candidatus Schmidhempelia sp.]